MRAAPQMYQPAAKTDKKCSKWWTTDQQAAVSDQQADVTDQQADVTD